MSEQTNAPTQPEPASSESAIANLRGAIDSIASNDLNIQEQPKEESTQANKTVESEPQSQKEEKIDASGEQEGSKAESSDENVQQDESPEPTKDQEPSGEKEKIRWKELKQAEKELKAAQRELAELKSKGEEYEQSSQEVAALKAEIEKIQQEREEIDSELYMTRVQATKEWNQYVTEPLNGIIEGAEFYAARNKIDAGELIDALQADSNGDASKLDNLMADWSERDKSKVWTLADNLLQIENRKAELERHSKEAYEISMERSEREMHERYQQYLDTRYSAISEVLPKVSEKVFSLLPEDKRPNVKKIQSEIMNYDSWPEDLKVYGILGATVLPDLIDTVQSLQKQLAETKETNIKLRGGSPSAAGGNSPKSPADSSKPVDYTKVDTDDFVKSLVSRMAV